MSKMTSFKDVEGISNFKISSPNNSKIHEVLECIECPAEVLKLA